jgi:hypothetical protein
LSAGGGRYTRDFLFKENLQGWELDVKRGMGVVPVIKTKLILSKPSSVKNDYNTVIMYQVPGHKLVSSKCLGGRLMR